MLRIPFHLISTTLIISLISGCAHLENINIARMFRLFSPTLQARHIDDVRVESRKLLAEGKAEESLQLLHNEIAGGTDPAAFSLTYPRAFNLLLAQGKSHFDNSEYLTAGRMYRLALRRYPDNKVLQAKIESTPSHIRVQIDLCADKLLESGLVAYRSGQLQAAINVWTQIRRFHPTYKPSQQAIETTRLQLNNLKRLPGDPG